jgi:tRNA threonylcarbamoyladenosine biosynthesis protein TsaE
VTELVTKSPSETSDCGARLGELLLPGDFVALTGELGAGKTQFVKGVAAGLNVASSDPVTSPTYALLNIYNGRIPLFHFDLYRLKDETDIAELGFEEYFRGDGACIVEWAERLGELLPKENIIIQFNVDDAEHRTLSFLPTGSRAMELVRLLLEPIC